VISYAACMYNVMPQTGCSALFKRAIYLVGARSPLPERLQRDEHPSVILSNNRPAGSDIGVLRDDRGVLRHNRENRLHAVLHRLRGAVLRAFGDADDEARVMSGATLTTLFTSVPSGTCCPLADGS
jgi:hypothetical protein